MQKTPLTNPCPLCRNETTELFHREVKRDYWICSRCDLVFVPPAFHPDCAAEKTRYDFHRHCLEDSGYRNFLNRLFLPVKNQLAPGACGLDFGCGQTPTLSVLFKEAGFSCADYDLYYHNNPAVLARQYDILTCSETIEHFRRPNEEIDRFLRLVKPGGWIGIMTQLRDEAPPFDQWFYKDDLTHLCFFSRKTFQTIAAIYGLKLHFFPNSVILLQRS